MSKSYEGSLRKKANGRYEVGGYELTSGEVVDYYDEDLNTFITSRIEHNGEEYYIVDLGRDKSIAGVHVRIK